MPAASLHPVAGTATEVASLLADWLEADEPPPLVVRTSGSTGEPKDVALSARAVRVSATATLERLGGAGQWVLALPVHYVAGLQVVVRSLLAGTDPVEWRAVDASLAAAADQLTASRRYLALVPTQLQRLLADAASRETLTGFDAILVGGAATEASLYEEARATGMRVVRTYGMTETCGGCVYDGEPLSGVDVRIREDGRVLLRGAVLFDGYVGRPDLTEAALQDGWLVTDDRGRLGADGRLQVLGRADAVAISGGVKVPLPLVEQRLRRHPAVEEAAVFAVPDAEWGERVVAVVVARDGQAAPSLVDVRDFVAADHPREWAPREVHALPKVPRLPSGKLDRQAARRLVAVRR